MVTSIVPSVAKPSSVGYPQMFTSYVLKEFARSDTLIQRLDLEIALRAEVARLRAENERLRNLRPEVIAFAEAMEERLRANDHKPGWKDTPAYLLVGRMREETNELDCAADAIREIGWDCSDADRISVLLEAADVGNFAMMVADVCGALLPALVVSPQ